MLYVCSKQNIINEYWKKEFGKKYQVKVVDIDFFYFEQDFSNNDILILDIDQFETLDGVLEYFNSLPKVLKTIAVLSEPKLAHGTYLIKYGFKSYIGKKTSKLIVDKALGTVIEGNIWLYPEFVQMMVNRVSSTTVDLEAINTLTKKEKDVANLISNGMSNKDIAQELNLTERTIKSYVSSLFKKLKVTDRLSIALKFQ